MKAKKKISIELKKNKLAKLTNLNTSEIKGGSLEQDIICSNPGGMISRDKDAYVCHIEEGGL